MLEVNDLSAGYGSTQVLHRVSLRVAPGQSACLIGANGAGKTTLLRCIAGLLRPSAGRITISGRDIGAAPASARLGFGMALVPEWRRVFAPMSVRENLEMGAFRRLWPRRDPRVAADMAMVFDLFPRLWERRTQAAGLLSGGEQQMLAIGRALMSRPRLLLLDEPSMGLAPQLIQLIFRIIAEINEQGTTVLLVEQNASQALSIAHRAYVLETGVVVKTGTGAELLGDESVVAAYLGGG
jgi:branched-chain amino acid transport system ATP-binding protein